MAHKEIIESKSPSAATRSLSFESNESFESAGIDGAGSAPSSAPIHEVMLSAPAAAKPVSKVKRIAHAVGLITLEKVPREELRAQIAEGARVATCAVLRCRNLLFKAVVCKVVTRFVMEVVHFGLVWLDCLSLRCSRLVVQHKRRRREPTRRRSA